MNYYFNCKNINHLLFNVCFHYSLDFKIDEKYIG